MEPFSVQIAFINPKEDLPNTPRPTAEGYTVICSRNSLYVYITALNRYGKTVSVSTIPVEANRCLSNAEIAKKTDVALLFA